VKVLLVGNSAQIEGFVDAAREAELAVERRREDEPAGGGDEAPAAIAADLREFEAALTATDHPDAVVVASDSNASLAAVIVATKVGSPVAVVSDPDRQSDGANGRLIRQLADRELAAAPAAIVDWVRGTYTDPA
jgi:hypothetical protein